MFSAAIRMRPLASRTLLSHHSNPHQHLHRAFNTGPKLRHLRPSPSSTPAQASARRRLSTTNTTTTTASSTSKAKKPTTAQAAAAVIAEQQAHRRLGYKIMFGLVGTAGAIGGFMYYRALEEDEAAKRALEDPSVAVEAPPAEFVHPYLEKPWWWRVLFAIKRAIYVAYVFLPVTGVGLISTYVFPNSEQWRERFLNSLIRAMERAGCCFMKLGQWISMRPDMFPRDVVKTMARLREGVPEHSFAFTRDSIKESFGKDIPDIFETFEEKPIASGTVAQVYRARLRPEYAIHGTIQDVAVKVRHPSILDETFLDMDLIFGFVDSCFPDKYSMPCSQDELTHILRQQLDLKWEAYNLYKFSTNFRHELKSGLIHFPQVSKELCTDAVLVESWVEGSTIATVFSEIEGGNAGSGDSWSIDKALPDNFSEAMKAKKKELARVLFDMNVKMFLRDNYVHGDMHAGNLMFSMEDGRVTVIDAGLITSLKPDVSNKFGDFLRALCSSDVDTIVDKLMEFNVGKVPVDKAMLHDKIREITDRFKSLDEGGDGVKVKATGDHYALGDVVGEILLNLQKFKIVLRGDVAASIMTISVSEGLILQLDPTFNLISASLPFFVKYKGWASAEAVMRGGKKKKKEEEEGKKEEGEGAVAAVAS